MAQGRFAGRVAGSVWAVAWLAVALASLTLLRQPVALPAHEPAPAVPGVGTRAADADAPKDDGVAVDASAALRTAMPPAPPRMRPLPTGADWVDVRAVDGRTGAPQPGLPVAWFDDDAEDWLAQQPDPRAHAEAALPAQIAANAGWGATTDRDGIVRVTLGEYWTQLVASDGERFGTLRIDRRAAPPRGGHRLALHAEPPLHVTVVDGDGAPCAGVPIAVVAFDDRDVPIHGSAEPVVAHTDEAGRATVPHIRSACAWRRQHWPVDAGKFVDVVTWRVRAQALGSRARGERFDPEAPPATPLPLRLPPVGTLAVRAVVDGAPMPHFRRARAARCDAEEDGGRGLDDLAWARVGIDGFARFHHVVVGVQYTIASDDHGEMRAETSGPPTAGGERVVTLAPPNWQAVAVGRALGPDGAPLRRCRLAVRGLGLDLRGGGDGTAHTDGDGNFRIGIEARDLPLPASGLRFDATSAMGRPLRAVVALDELRAGDLDVGDVILAVRPTLVAGRLVRANTPYLGPIELAVQATRTANQDDEDEDLAQETAAGALRWRNVPDTAVWRGADGAFAVHGETLDAPHRLAAAHERLLPTTPTPFAVGARDLVVELAPAAALAASAFVPPGTPATALRFRLAPADGPLPPDPDGEDPTIAVADEPIGDRVHATWPAVPHGRYRLVVSTWLTRTDLLTIPDVTSPPPPGGDPRLSDLDLRAQVRTVAIHITGPTDADDEGVRDRGLGLVLIDPRRAGATWRADWFRDDEAKVLLPMGPCELLVARDSCRPLRITAGSDTIAVTPIPWPRVALRLPNLPPLPRGVTAWVTVTAPSAAVGRYVTSWGAGELAELYASSVHGAQLEAGTVKLPIGDGLHTLELQLRSSERTVAVACAAPTTFVAADLTVELAVEPAAWTDAIARVTAAHPAPDGR